MARPVKLNGLYRSQDGDQRARIRPVGTVRS
jgi:hypothetical protein